MPKLATLGTNLVDRLVPTVDRLRSSLYPKFGVRQLTVDLVLRTWSGTRRGEGTSSILSSVTLDPRPTIVETGGYRLMAGGVDSADRLTLTEISLRYTEGELTGRPLRENDEFYYRVRDAHGQKMKTTYYQLDGDPNPDREKNIGWSVSLKRVEIQE